MATLFAGSIGLWLLFIRTRAAERTARAALDQAKVAANQAKTAADRHEEQTKADRERRITESFAKAVEQLGSNKLETRLGGIYTLERIAQESEGEYWPIMETLTAYVRVHAPWPPRPVLGSPFVQLQTSTVDRTDGESAPAEQPKNAAEQTGAQIWPSTDIQAVLTVLGRRNEKARQQDEEAKRRLDFVATDLRNANVGSTNLQGADLRSANLQGALLTGAHLEGANLSGVSLEGANLSGAYLEGADLREAHLEGDYLERAHLEGANLSEAHLEGTNLRGAYLKGANLSGAYLQGALLTGAHLEGAGLVYADLESANIRGAYLEGAKLERAHLEGANLSGAHLEGADLRDAAGVTQEQLDRAFGDDNTLLPSRPEGLRRPAHWSKAQSAAPAG
jgi:uncharacterized protein YjbI with pentapeptide repeats